MARPSQELHGSDRRGIVGDEKSKGNMRSRGRYRQSPRGSDAPVICTTECSQTESLEDTQARKSTDDQGIFIREEMPGARLKNSGEEEHEQRRRTTPHLLFPENVAPADAIYPGFTRGPSGGAGKLKVHGTSTDQALPVRTSRGSGVPGPLSREVLLPAAWRERGPVARSCESESCR